MRTFPGRSQRLTRSTTWPLSQPAMYLETLDRRSLVRPRPLREKASLLRSRKRPAGTPPSTFLFLLIHLSNSPEPLPIPPSNHRRPESRRSLNRRPRSEAWSPNISEELRRRAIAPSGGAPLGAYMLREASLSTTRCAKFAANEIVFAAPVDGLTQTSRSIARRLRPPPRRASASTDQSPIGNCDR